VSIRRHWHEAVTLLRPTDGPHGPLPPLLVTMTVLTGAVDAVSYLALHHVFVANMTGNVVFLAFALAGAAGFAWAASVEALIAFAIGAALGGRLAIRLPSRRRLVAAAAVVEAVLIIAAAVVALAGALMPEYVQRYALVGLLAVAMGLQNAVARGLAVPDLTTTVLTLTWTGIAADGALGGGPDSRVGRRLVSVVAMFVGALAGSVLVLTAGVAGAMTAVAVLSLVLAAGALLTKRLAPDWAGT